MTGDNLQCANSLIQRTVVPSSRLPVFRFGAHCYFSAVLATRKQRNAFVQLSCISAASRPLCAGLMRHDRDSRRFVARHVRTFVDETER